jgi:antibiotic biosynthesis monooxygenase (ABM) superfamily enzyme
MAAFIAVLASLVVYVTHYLVTKNDSDRFQVHILVSVALTGVVLALNLGFGFQIGTLCVAPRIIIFGLLVSDLTHICFPGLRRQRGESSSNEAHGVASARL